MWHSGAAGKQLICYDQTGARSRQVRRCRMVAASHKLGLTGSSGSSKWEIALACPHAACSTSRQTLF